MSIRLTIPLAMNSDDVISTYGAGAKLYLDSAATEGGSYSNVTSTAIVSGTEVYELVDANGTSSTWYKTRVGNTGGTAYSEYDTAFQATSVLTYATVDEFERSRDMPTGTGSSRRRAFALDCLVEATDYVTVGMDRSFFRNPQVSGTSTFTFNVVNSGARTLQEAIGRGLDIISITTLEYRESSTGAYAAIAAGTTGYLLDPLYSSLGSMGTVIPYDVLRLSADSATRTTYPTGDAAIRLVGALGWPRIPPMVRRATIELAWMLFRGDSLPQQGVNQFGTPVLATGLPASYKLLINSPYRRQTFAVYV